MPQHLTSRPGARSRALNLSAFGLFLLAGLLGAQEQGEKLPIPTKDQQAKAQALIDDIFKEDFERAKSAEAKFKLAEYLFQQGKESGDSPANRYMLYLHTQKLAAEAGNFSFALTAIDELHKQFKIDGLKMKTEALATAANAAQGENAQQLAEAALGLITEAVEDDNYPAAKELGEVAAEAARKAKSVKLVVAIQKRVGEVAQLQKKYDQLKPYLQKLDKNPADAEANLEMGKYYGLLKGKWAKALPLLAKGGDAELKALAQKDLDGPKEPSAQVELADNWWDLAKKQEGLAKKTMQQRAAHWYTQALDRLTGLNRTKALKRIEQVGAEGQSPVVGVSLGPPGKVGELRRLSGGHTQEIKSVAFSPDGRLGLSGGVDNKLLLWDLKEGKLTQSFVGHTKQVWGVAFHPNGKQIFSSSWDATAKLWDIAGGKEVHIYQHPIDVNGLAVSADGKALLVGCDQKFMRLWDADAAQKVRDYTGATNYVYGVAFSPDGRLVACGSLDQTARVYNKDTGQLVKDFPNHKDAVYHVAFAPDSKSLFTCGDDAAHQFDLASGKEVKRFGVASSSVRDLALTKDGRHLVTGSGDNTVRLWDVASGHLIQAFPGHPDQVSAVAVTPDGRYALSGDYSGTLILWALPVK